MNTTECFDIECRQCPRLGAFLDSVKQKHPDYYARPVPSFGVSDPELLIVGLAPGMHGANASGRPFTGDYAGILLYDTLFKFGYSNYPESKNAHDGLVLSRCRITNAVKCLPPDNKPTGVEVRQCNHYLAAEINGLSKQVVILALGSIAHQAVIRALGLKLSAFKFAHNVVHMIEPGRYLVDSYHCSRYNVNTRRLTVEMFHQVFTSIEKLQNA
ncbi:MAG TPA: uracil-DNA glycosylase [Methylococcales bacterium]|nr:uracil-DNA glycosylase [Methylococcales bacterium]